MLNDESKTTEAGGKPETDSSVLVQMAGEPELEETNSGELDNSDGGEAVSVPPGEVEKTTKPKIEHRILIIHDDDQDGYCAAHIIRRHKKTPTVAVGMFPYRHGGDLRRVVVDVDKWDEIFIVDLATPLTWIRDLLLNGFHVTVVDHHESTLRAVEDFSDPKFCAYVGTAYSAAGLAWRYAHGEDSELPWVVKMINDWDIWNHEDPQVIPFHYGMQCIDQTNSRLWDTLLKGDANICTQVMQMGTLVGSYWVNRMNEITAENSYVIERDGIRFLVCNGNFSSSYDFAATMDAEKHDAIAWYKYDAQNQNWRFSMRTTKEGIDLLPIAAYYGGAGHKQSCGFHLHEARINEWLPVKYEAVTGAQSNTISENN